MGKLAFCFRHGNIMSATGIPIQLEKALNSYKANYSAYKVTGHAGHKSAYERSLAAVNTFIQQMNSVTISNDRYIRNFVGEYQSSNSELVNLQENSKRIQEEGPKLQDELARSRQIHQRAAIEADESGLYVKAGIVVALLVVVGIVGSL
jgi:translation initiation factor 2B subunit (eIF-2B alpha/beta/delta family)